MVERDFSSGSSNLGLFGRKPMIGLSLFFIGSLIFIALALNLIYTGPLIKLDLFLVEWFHNFALNSSPLLTNIMIAGFYVGLQGVEIFDVTLGLYFLYKRFWRELVMAVVAFSGGGLLFRLLSTIFMRPRPFLSFEKQIWAGGPNIPGFPSGHTLSIVVLCGLLIYLFLPKIKSYFGKFLMISIAVLLIFYMGISRLYVGDHYLTDVVAGYAVGLAWFGLSITLIELGFKKYYLKKEKKLEYGNRKKSYK